jgi:hypothetical protein
MGSRVMEMAEGRHSGAINFFCVHLALIILYHGFCKSQPALGEPASINGYHGKKIPISI